MPRDAATVALCCTPEPSGLLLSTAAALGDEPEMRQDVGDGLLSCLAHIMKVTIHLLGEEKRHERFQTVCAFHHATEGDPAAVGS